MAVAAALVIVGAIQPRLAAQILYVAGGVALGFGSTKFLRFAASNEAKAKLATLGQRVLQLVLGLRSQLRNALLRFDPSLADDEDKPIGLSDLRGPFGKKKGGPPPWKRPGS